MIKKILLFAHYLVWIGYMYTVSYYLCSVIKQDFNLYLCLSEFIQVEKLKDPARVISFYLCVKLSLP